MNLFQLGEFTLNSGKASQLKIDCDALTGKDIMCLVYMIRELVGPFSQVNGVPRGGIRLAESLEGFAVSLKYQRVLLVDDVLTTGGSMKRYREKISEKRQESTEYIGAVIFARGPCPHWIKPLFQLPKELWIKEQADAR